MSFIEELKRRRVVRVALVYAATAFVVWQAADIAFPALHLPAWMVTAVIALTLLGFPIALVLTWAFEITPDGVQRTDAAGAGTERWLSRRTLAAVGVALLLVIAGAWFVNPVVSERLARAASDSGPGRVGSDGDPAGQPAVRFRLTPPEDEGQMAPGNGMFAVSPDGRAYVYAATTSNTWGLNDGERQLYYRRIDEVNSRALPGTAGGRDPTFSPDGRWIAFLVGSELQKISVEGAAPVRIARLTDDQVDGVAWAGETIVVSQWNAGLLRVPADGGAMKQLTAIDSTRGDHGSPVALADGETVLFTEWGREPQTQRIGIVSLRTGAHEFPGVEGSRDVVGMAAGHLVYIDTASAMLGAPWDARRRRVIGPPVGLLEGVSAAALSASGTLIYQRYDRHQFERAGLFAIGLSGSVQPVSSLQRGFRDVRYSPDGRRIAATILADGASDVWVHDIASGTLLPITRGLNAYRPEWTPDGRWLLYVHGDTTMTAVWRRPADASGPAELLQPNANQAAVLPDGRTLVYKSSEPANQLWLRSLSGDTTSRPLAVPPDQYTSPSVSPDGRWIAYSSNLSGSWQIYVQPLPGLGARQPITIDGGDHAVWAPQGLTLYYSSGARLHEAVITESPSFSVRRRSLTDLGRTPWHRYHRYWDLAPDGTHVLTVREDGARFETIVVHNWVAELRARLNTASPGQR